MSKLSDEQRNAVINQFVESRNHLIDMIVAYTEALSWLYSHPEITQEELSEKVDQLVAVGERLFGK